MSDQNLSGFAFVLFVFVWDYYGKFSIKEVSTDFKIY